MVGKAAAFLFRHQKIKGVYSLRGMGGIPCQIDEMIQKIDEDDTEYYTFEQSLNNVESPEDAYKVLKEKI